jgi:hypothetical protein
MTRGSSFVEIESFEIENEKEPIVETAERFLSKLPGVDPSEREARFSKNVLRDQRVVQVGSHYGAWRVVAAEEENQSLPVMLRTICYLRCDGRDFTIAGFYNNFGDARTFADFDRAQAELLQISQSFRPPGYSGFGSYGP